MDFIENHGPRSVLHHRSMSSILSHPMRMRKTQSESGYVLLALLLFVALLSIGVFTTIQKVDFQIKRDREEEMIHRGVQYSRAVRKYFKAFGRYPTRIEELESTNNQRFLRHRYKDPITGKDFKLLRLGDVQMSFGSTPGIPVAQMNNQQQGAPEALNSEAKVPAGPGPSSIVSQNSPNGAPSDAAQADQGGSGTEAGTPPPPQPLSQQAGPTGAPQVFGGGGIVGVASISKDKTIREFNKKNHYNQWQFIYDPTTDRGGLLMTPNQPPLMLNNPPAQQPNGMPSTTAAPGMGSSVGPSPAQQNQQ
jgi:type II secretory pathway pseudopilin PulG